MEQWEIDWYHELSVRYCTGEDMSEDDVHRLNFLRNKYVCYIADHPSATFYVRNPGEAAMMRVPGSGR